ncbi:MAG: nucleotidyltransferase domain-containing protein, partial [Synechococcaceae cyanobacterium]|nr:nucleotidyltransferase domain-containing protein [Synechococcaceae cyanobacterium]
MSGSPAPSKRQRLNQLRYEGLVVAQRHGASNQRVVGSIAQGTEHSGSDLDLLVDLSPDQSLLGLISLRQELEDLLGCPVDVSE